MPSATPMPTLFVSHGSPMLALERTPTSDFLRGLAARLPKPNAILAISAHWETDIPKISGAAHPGTLHDFRGFPEALYQLRYDAPGDPPLAEHIRNLLAAAGFAAAIDADRPRDHGVWNPLLLIYPEAQIPVLQLSIQPEQDAHYHYGLGHALAALRAEGVLIMGSGNLTHNLREAFNPQSEQRPAWVVEFAEWVARMLAQGNIAALLDWEKNAPHAARNHPTVDHFLPFFVALGAAGNTVPERLHAEIELGVLAMDSYLWQA